MHKDVPRLIDDWYAGEKGLVMLSNGDIGRWVRCYLCLLAVAVMKSK